MSANFTPDLGTVTATTPFRFWCQKVMPAVYDDSLSYYELLCKVVNKLNEIITNNNTIVDDITKLGKAYNQLQDYVNTTYDSFTAEVKTEIKKLEDYMNHYFDSLDISAEVDKALDKMAEDGTLAAIMQPIIQDASNPKVVDSVSGMTNKNYSYILKTNGHLYQYKNNAWTDTGYVYGGADDTVMKIMPNPPLDLSDGISKAGVYFHKSTDPKCLGTPNGLYANKAFTCISYYKERNSHYQVFIGNDGCVYTRQEVNNAWLDWEEYSVARSGENDWDLTTVNTAKNGVVIHTPSMASAVGTPNDETYRNKAFILVSFSLYGSYGAQLFFDVQNNYCYYRHNVSSGWSNWKMVFADNPGLPALDLNNIKLSGAFFHAPTDEVASNTPFGLFNNEPFLLVSHSVNDIQRYQMLYPYNTTNGNATCYIRHQLRTNVWGEWSCVNTTGGKLPDTDLNNIKDSGVFFNTANDDTPMNTPSDLTSKAFMLENYYRSPDEHYQTLRSYSNPGIWTRRGSLAGAFTPWKKLNYSGSSKQSITLTFDGAFTYTITSPYYIFTLKRIIDSNTDLDSLIPISLSHNKNLWKGIGYTAFNALFNNVLTGGLNGHEKDSYFPLIIMDNVNLSIDTKESVGNCLVILKKSTVSTSNTSLSLTTSLIITADTIECRYGLISNADSSAIQMWGAVNGDYNTVFSTSLTGNRNNLTTPFILSTDELMYQLKPIISNLSPNNISNSETIINPKASIVADTFYAGGWVLTCMTT